MTTTADALLGGRVGLAQPTGGYRVSNDAIFLAASVAAADTGRILDVGCGVGGASLCVAVRLADARVTGLDIDPSAVALAVENASANALGDRVEFSVADVGAGVPDGFAGAFSCVMSNPPFLPSGRADLRGADAGARRSEIEMVPLPEWIDFMLACAAPGGRLRLVHRADRIDDILSALRTGTGDIRVFPLWPRAGVPAKRVLVSARKGSRAASAVLPGMAVHEADGAYTRAAREVLEQARGLDL